MNSRRQAARKFREYWTLANESEVGGYQKFWISLLGDVLGAENAMERISFQTPVPMPGTTKYLDAWIPETRVLIEHKSRGIKLDAPQSGHGGKTPFEQAVEYNQARGFSEKARWIVTCNFDEIWVYDMDRPFAEPQKIWLGDLPKEVARLEFLVDSSVKSVREKEKNVSIQAGRIVGELYRELLKRYADPESPETLKFLNRLCVRLVFLFYAEDADLFPKDAFWTLLKNTEAKNLRRTLLTLFHILDTPEAARDPYLEPEIAAFPYTNGGLFKGVDEAEIPPLDDEIRELLARSSNFDWREISPTIFGALFESTLNPVTRRAGGMVYTSVENIHKVIDPLFLDGLTAELEAIKKERTVASRRARALAFQEKLGSLTFLDPACGSGNFLTETFLSLRRLENEAIQVGERLKPGERLLNLDGVVKVSIEQFHGIEINDFAVSVAKTAMWISEAKMLQQTAEILAVSPKFLPLHDYDGVVEGNALRMDWGEVIARRAEMRRRSSAAEGRFGVAEPEGCASIREPQRVFVMGNPPFVGYSNQSSEQKADMLSLYCNESGKPYKTAGKIDYVAGWYWKAAEFCAVAKRTDVAFVSTNSITQGEQVAAVWKSLLDRFGLEIDFAWRTFKWDSEAMEKAHVHCVIVGFHCRGQGTEGTEGAEETRDKATAVHVEAAASLKSLRSLSSLSSHPAKTIYDSDGTAIPAAHINGYLMDAPDVWIESRAKPLCDVPEMKSGGKPVEGGHLMFTAQEKEEFLRVEPMAAKYFRRMTGSEEYINGIDRWCLWLDGVSPSAIRSMPHVMERVRRVRDMRLSSVKAATRKAAEAPWQFMEIKQPDSDFILVPKVSSEKREYVPMGFFSPEVICSDLVFMVPSATLYHFGVLTSRVHMAWMRAVAGRLKSDYRYSGAIVYNNFPWPNLCDSASLREKISQTAQAILDARARDPDSSLADLYDPLTMPPDLRAAHEANDRAVLAAYGLRPDMPEPEVVARLFGLYAETAKEMKKTKATGETLEARFCR